ncbi:TIGR02530 family flagellar biosynthesis protein [Halothermothrix orenii]|uniref:Flagellar operon protein n=1 Tax=Halothermothrix orenii (strain H 168 / OCM 544 / DSM 9562) TaxID=373903 RepID=B8CYR2_HALOH|nr:TIGR02530 family flagellar biosynthesis protein [Halothermothrix orenii]ACL70431.1 flagellar operon protein [Halothermothrix orenii H 168]
MVDNRLIVNHPINPAGKVQKKPAAPDKTDKQGKKVDFKKVLSRQLKEKTGVKFSKHAQNRLVSRNINLTEKDLNQLKNGIKKAEEKGSRDSLIMVNNVAYVVSVENKTVITAIDDSNIKENVFTNIDSAVFM